MTDLIRITNSYGQVLEIPIHVAIHLRDQLNSAILDHQALYTIWAQQHASAFEQYITRYRDLSNDPTKRLNYPDQENS